VTWTMPCSRARSLGEAFGRKADRSDRARRGECRVLVRPVCKFLLGLP